MFNRQNFHEGDIVLYFDPYRNSSLNNMITHVLDAFPRDKTVLIRGRGNHLEGSTTAVVSAKHLQLLRVSPHSPLQVPGKPVECSITGNNDATWQEIPLGWFIYEMPQKKSAA